MPTLLHAKTAAALMAMSVTASADLAPETLSELKQSAVTWGEIARVATYCKMSSSENLARYLTLHATKYYGANREEITEILRAYITAGSNIDLPRIDCTKERAKTQPILDNLRVEVMIYECWDITKRNLATCTAKYKK
jgi:hypothetical protein